MPNKKVLPVELQKEFGLRLRTWIQRKNLQHKEFAYDIGMDTSNLSRIINGKDNLTMGRIVRILNGLRLKNLGEFYSDGERGELERVFHEDFNRLRDLLLVGTASQVDYVRESIDLQLQSCKRTQKNSAIVVDMLEWRERHSPS